MLQISNFAFINETRFEQEEKAAIQFRLTNNFNIDLANVKLTYNLGNGDIAVLPASDMGVASLAAGQTIAQTVVLESAQTAETGTRTLSVDATFDFAGQGAGNGLFPFVLSPD